MDAELPKKLGILFQPMRYKILHGGRGSGKSWGVARALLSLAWHKPMRILCARETQKSIDESVHRLLRDQIGILGLSDFFEVQETKIIGLNGSIFTFAGIRQQGVVNLKSFEAVDIVWIEEAQVVTRRSWDVLIPTIRKTGSEIWITFNPELDTDETYERFVLNPPEKSVVVEMNWQDNPWFPAELEDERIAWLKRDPVGYETVWEGKCRPAVEGAIYAREIDDLQRSGRLCRVPYDPLLKVHTIWDLGYNDSTSIIMVQRSASEIRVIDHICDNLRPLDSYVNELKERGYNWGIDYLPHDARSHNMATGKSVEEIAKKLGRNVQITPDLDVEQGIQAARLMFRRCYFDKDKAKSLINSLKRYKRAINQTTNEPGAPLHDSASHDADAFRYLAVVADKLRNEVYVPKPARSINRGAGAGGWMM